MASSAHSESLSTVSVEVSPGPSSVQLPGRPTRSLVWEYYTYDRVVDKSICQVESPDGMCGKSVSGKNPTNLKRHLRAAHPQVMNDFKRKEEDMKKNKAEKHKKKCEESLKHYQQSTLRDSFTKQVAYSKESKRYKFITRKLAIFVGSSNVANHLVENLEFKDLVRALDPRYPVPGRASINKELDQVFIELKAKISVHLQSANFISICSDIWSKKGLTSSYLGITAHFFSRSDHRRHTATRAVRRLVSSHTAYAIRQSVDEILAEWDIDPTKILAILTDNGSNMVAAFKAKAAKGEEEEEDIEGKEELSVDEDEQDFEACEIEHNEEFGSLNRIGCFSHTLQLVVSKFDDLSLFKEVMKRAHLVVRKVNASTKATERLVALAGKKLVKDCPTRWSSTYLMVTRLIDVKEKLKVVLEEQGWDDLAASEWRTLTHIANLLQPFAKFTSLLSGDEFTTLSCVVPAVMDMNIHLQEMKKVHELSPVAEVLLSELKRRFMKYTAPGVDGDVPVMLAATALDVCYRLLLNAVQLESAKKMLMEKLVRNGSRTPSQCDSPVPPGIPDEDEGPPPERRFKHLEKVLQLRIKEDLEKTSHLPPGKAELDRYFSSIVTMPESVDPISFWIENEAGYPLLSSLAIDILCIPASSAPVERTFSTAGESTSGRRNRLSDKNLEREVLIRKNKHYL